MIHPRRRKRGHQQTASAGCALRSRLAAEAKPQAARFSWARAVEETLRVFENAVQDRRARLDYRP